jgi:putative ABC transport system permease protein
VGDGVVKQYDGLDVGKKVRWGNTDWTVVGRFTDGGGIAESEAWGDTRVVQQAWRRGNSFQSIRVRLNDAASLKTLKDALTKDPRVRVGVQTERAFYADQQKLMSTIITTVGVTLAIMMGIAALFAALNTLYNAVATRVREIATLRALGFGGFPVVVSVLVEAMILGAVGGLIGGLLAFLSLNGMHSSTMNWASFSQMTFAFTVTPGLMLLGIIYGLILCFIAGILPGIRAARLPITAGLREL